TNTYFAQEVSDRVRVVACLTTLPNIVDSDTSVEALTTSEWQNICSALRATKDDTLVVVWGDEADAKTGAQEIIIRAKEATVGVPSETRQALRDGTNGFERILPGPDRMYPDTDLPPKQVTRERLTALRLKLPRPIWEREASYRELKVPEDCVKPLAMSRIAPLFERAVKEWRAEPVATAVALIQYPKRLRRKGLDVGRLDGIALENVLRAFGEGKMIREGIWPALEFITQNGTFDAGKWPPPAAVGEVARAIKDGVKKLNGLKLHNPDRKSHVLMGLVMARLRGRAAGADMARKVEAVLREKA
ncbi:MAG: hypothetical protein OEW05_09365, partial [Candidatus Aminicenantes bacterium]|nr:hypothetical protein [Candidatus Aminicenantes bacterium]